MLMVLILAITVPVMQSESRVESLREEIEGPRVTAEKAQAVNAELKQLIESRQFLVDKKNND